MGQAQVVENETDVDLAEEANDELKPGHTLMQGQYTIEAFLNAGGFGITYLARNSLDRKVVIKECFPGAFCRRSTSSVVARSRSYTKEFSSIVRGFVDEAHSLAKVKHPNVVGVHQVFEENKTAYMAMDFVEGRDFLDVIQDNDGMPSPAQIEVIFKKLLDAVGHIHSQDMLHRDISPDNILLNADLEPILIDFGAARQDTNSENRILSELRVVKDGYSPQEFYVAGAEQGPYSDLYALAASFYHVVTGDLPVNSQTRIAAVAGGEDDPYVPLAGQHEGYSDAFLRGIDKALATLPKDRFASAASWLAVLEGGAAPQLKTSAAKAPVTPSINKTKSRALAIIALTIPVLGGMYVMQSNRDTSVAAIAAATVAAPAEVEVAEAAPTPSEEAAAAPDLSTALNMAAIEAAQAQIDATSADATITALNLDNMSNALGLAPSQDVAEAPQAAAVDAQAAPVEEAAPAADIASETETVTQAPLILERFDVPQGSSFWTVDTAQLNADAIYAKGDVVLGTGAEIAPLLHDMLAAPTDNTIELAIMDGATETATVLDTVLVPVIHSTTLPDGTRFEARVIDGVWTTQVAAAPAGSDLQANDVVMGDLTKEVRFDQRTSLADTLVQANANNSEWVTIAVLRDGNLTAHSLPVPR